MTRNWNSASSKRSPNMVFTRFQIPSLVIALLTDCESFKSTCKSRSECKPIQFNARTLIDSHLGDRFKKEILGRIGRCSQIFVGINGWWSKEDIQFSHLIDSDNHTDPPIAISGAIQSGDRPMMPVIIISLINRTNRQAYTRKHSKLRGIN
jgi:hypothetical protein